ncbi:MAG: ABC-type transport auxiliary lipoprotein family protein, partial [Gammaproteobacteria bacterium]
SPGGTLVLSVRWVISAGDAREAAVVRQSTIEQPVTGDTVDALVQAHDAAVAQLSREIADQIRSL